MRLRSCCDLFPARWTLPFIFALLFGLTGCIGATRLPARSHGPLGADLKKTELDLSFVQVGATPRGEVIEKLHCIDTAYSSPHLFWGRWSDSKWGYWFVAAGGYQAAAEGGRIWHVHNLLIAFDDEGIATEQSLITDNDAVLWRQLHTRLRTAPSLDLSQPTSMRFSRFDPIGMTLTRETIHVERRKAIKSFDISALKVKRFRHAKYGTKGGAPGTTCHQLDLTEKTSLGKVIQFCASPADVAVMFQYLIENGTPDLAWE